jgi:hypothetical protein
MDTIFIIASPQTVDNKLLLLLSSVKLFCFHYAGINVLCGVGILSTPYAIQQGGWLGLVILGVFAVLAWYTGVLLRRCLDSTDGLQTYPDIGHAAFGTTGRIAISVKSPPSHIYLLGYISVIKCCANLVFFLVYGFTFLQIILYVELYVSTH